jgi:hypothetical protein
LNAAEIIKRWHRLFKRSSQSQAYINGDVPEGGEQLLLDSVTTIAVMLFL